MVMRNVFSAKADLGEVYDLKGSKVGRTKWAGRRGPRPSTLLDGDLDRDRLGVWRLSSARPSGAHVVDWNPSAGLCLVH